MPVPLRECRFLLAILVLLQLLFPFLAEMARPILLVAAVASVFVAGVIVVHPGKSRVRRAVTLAAVQIIFTCLAVLVTENSFLYRATVVFALAVTSTLISYCIYCVLRYVLQAHYITRDQIYAGICAYLMLGFAFGCIYYLIAMLDPGCFVVNTAKVGGAQDPDLMYFSFVTLATVGYGDITPATKSSRALAELEAMAGMIYIAVFMARLVSVAGGNPRNAGPPDRPA